MDFNLFYISLSALYRKCYIFFWRVSCLQRGVPTKIEWSSSIILNKLFWMISLFPFETSSAPLKYKYQVYKLHWIIQSLRLIAWLKLGREPYPKVSNMCKKGNDVESLLMVRYHWSHVDPMQTRIPMLQNDQFNCIQLYQFYCIRYTVLSIQYELYKSTLRVHFLTPNWAYYMLRTICSIYLIS